MDSSLGSTLIGSGSGPLVTKRFNTLREMILKAGDMVEDGNLTGACNKLASVLAKTDGDPNPKDFVMNLGTTSTAREQLYQMIVDLRTSLGCT